MIGIKRGDAREMPERRFQDSVQQDVDAELVEVAVRLGPRKQDAFHGGGKVNAPAKAGRILCLVDVAPIKPMTGYALGAVDVATATTLCRP